jgi:mono/diheme cytochrome c family protein
MPTPEASTAPDAPADPDAASPEPDAAPPEAGKSSGVTWTQIYDSYLAVGTIGNCGSCHGQADNASDTFTYIATSFAPTSFANCFTWSGGNMPLNGPASNPQAAAAVAAWVADGAQNN